MTGADIVGALLLAHKPLTDKVPEARIKLGKLPDGVELPALLLRTVSSVERPRLKRGELVRYTDRVAVTVRAANYRDQVAIIKIVRKCCAGFTGDHETAKNVAVLNAGTGPDVIGPANSFEQAQDFRVSFDAG